MSAVLLEAGALAVLSRGYAAQQVRRPICTHCCLSHLQQLFLTAPPPILLSYLFRWSKQSTKTHLDNDCTSAVTSKPSCANSSWTLYSTDSSPAEQVQDGYLFCCDEGSVGLDVGQCWASSDIVSGSVVGYATASAVSNSPKPLRSLEGGEFKCLWALELISSI